MTNRDKRRMSSKAVRLVPVDRIRPELGLGRKRDREGHRELCRSIEQFGVLTPITVRRAPDGSGEYLLIKGQGRTMACRVLGLPKIPAVIVDDKFADEEKVQQFLVENVARLRMRAIDRALLITASRRDGEETANVAARFGVSPSTVRRLEAQLDGATTGEVKALMDQNVSLSLHSVISRYVVARDRADVIRAVAATNVSAKEFEELLRALGWRSLVELGSEHRTQRLELLRWALKILSALPKGTPKDRIRLVADLLPIKLSSAMFEAKVVNQ